MTALPKVKWRALYPFDPVDACASALVEASREKLASYADAYHAQLEAELRLAIKAKKNLAVSPLLGDVVDGFRYLFVQCDGTYPAVGWTTYNCADFVPPADAKDKP